MKILEKTTKITCKCDKQKTCFWQVKKPFIGCIGPCEQPVRAVSNVKQFFKIKQDYSEVQKNGAFPNPVSTPGQLWLSRSEHGRPERPARKDRPETDLPSHELLMKQINDFRWIHFM